MTLEVSILRANIFFIFGSCVYLHPHNVLATVASKMCFRAGHRCSFTRTAEPEGSWRSEQVIFFSVCLFKHWANWTTMFALSRPLRTGQQWQASMSSSLISSWRNLLIFLTASWMVSDDCAGTPLILMLHFLLYCWNWVILPYLSFTLLSSSLHFRFSSEYSYRSPTLSLMADSKALFISSNMSFMNDMLFSTSRMSFRSSLSKHSRESFISTRHSCLNTSISFWYCFVL